SRPDPRAKARSVAVRRRMAALTHEKTILISEAHLDSFGHLNNARYLELFEQARWDLITERGFGVDTIRKPATGPVGLDVPVRYTRGSRRRNRSGGEATTPPPRRTPPAPASGRPAR